MGQVGNKIMVSADQNKSIMKDLKMYFMAAGCAFIVLIGMLILMLLKKYKLKIQKKLYIMR